MPSDQVGPVAVKVSLFHYVTAALARPSDDSETPRSEANLYARGKGEIFESDDEPFRAERRDAVSLSDERANRVKRAYRVAKARSTIYFERRMEKM